MIALRLRDAFLKESEMTPGVETTVRRCKLDPRLKAPGFKNLKLKRIHSAFNLNLVFLSLPPLHDGTAVGEVAVLAQRPDQLQVSSGAARVWSPPVRPGEARLHTAGGKPPAGRASIPALIGHDKG